MNTPSPLEAIFFAALEKDSAPERAAYLDQACAGDADLRRRVEKMLTAQSKAGSFLEDPHIGGTIDEPVPEKAGTVIGPYKLIEEIGEGGMGTVWMAQQTEPVKRAVAVKLIKAGMDSKQVLARFEAERQALALMDHPNIAKVFDAGTIDSQHTAQASAEQRHLLALRAPSVGRPYFVMELVKGVPITKYCDEHRLTPRQRLELFVPVCQAIQHAHQKGIIHRDIKPSNILVAQYDGRPVPKVIDFGVAKAAGQQLTDKTLMTGFGSVVGTLEYMSPEQAELNQLDIDTRSDIYSLGVVLYELLTGSTPLNKKRLKQAAFAEILRAIREEEPQKPSTRLSHSTDSLPSVSAQRQMEPAKLTKLVRGELDWIVMKALDKDRSRRYETANGFAMDVQRYLADEPVLACPPSAGYRLRKFARRNRARLTVATVLCLALLAVLTTAAGSVGWVARDRSGRQARLNSQAEVILDDAERLGREQNWNEAAAAAERAEAVLAGGEVSETIRRRIREVHRDRDFVAELDRVRQIRAANVNGSLDYFGAARGYTSAFHEYGVDIEELPVEESVSRLKQRPALAPAIVAALDDWAHARWTLDKSDPSFRKHVAVVRALDPDPLRDRLRAIWGRQSTPEVQGNLRHLAESIDVPAQSPTTLLLLIALLQKSGLGDLALQTAQRSQSLFPGDFWLNIQLGNLLDDRKNYAQAQVYCTIGIALRPDCAVARNNLGIALENQGQYDEAIACYRKAMALDRKYSAPHNSLGNLYFDQKDFEKARVCYLKALELDPNNTQALNNLGIVHTRQKKFDDAIASYSKAIELNPKDTVAIHNLGLAYSKYQKPDQAMICFQKAVQLDPKFANAYCDIGTLLREQGKVDEAIVCFKKAIEADPKCALAYNNLGVTFRERKQFKDAFACYRKALEVDPNSAAANMGLGVAMLDQSKFAAAVPYFEKVIELGQADAEVHNSLGYAFLNMGKLDEAIPHLKKAIELNPTHIYAPYNLGLVYLRQTKLDEAIDSFRMAMEVTPGSAGVHTSLGDALRRQKKLDQAIASYHKAIELDPKYAPAHHGLGLAFHDQGKRDEAIAEFCEAFRLEPRDVGVRNWLLETLAPLGRLEQVRTVWEKVLAGNPPQHEVWFGYAELCLFLNNEDAYQRNRAALLKRFANTTDPAIAERTARASLLLPATGEELQAAIALADRAVTLGKNSNNFRYYAVAKALAEYRLGKFESTIEWCQKPGAQGTSPTLLLLALAHQQLGHTEEARRFFDKAIDTYDWKNLDNEWGGIIHSLRREAEALLKVKSGVKEPVAEKKPK
jgi:tetratricopeptide (TPR) repeat protein/serine/threonine protein kinase